MTSRSQLGGQSRVVSLPCGFSAGSAGIAIRGPKITTTSGETTAGTLKTLLNITGSKARLNALVVTAADATSRNIRVVITVDGSVVFDNTASAVTDTNGRLVVGYVIPTGAVSVGYQPVDANTSLKIEFSSSLSETDKLSFECNYEVRQ